MHAVQLSNLSRSDGSAILASGETVIQAAVYGPTEIKVSKELHDKAFLEVSVKPKVGQSDVRERLMESFIRNAFEPVILSQLHPRTSISVIIQEIHNSGNMLSCCVNSACLALLDAGISMKGIVAAVCIAVNKDRIVPFPSEKDLKTSKCIVTVALSNPGANIVGLKVSSFLSQEQISKCLEVAKSSAEDIFQFFRETMQKRYSKSIS